MTQQKKTSELPHPEVNLTHIGGNDEKVLRNTSLLPSEDNDPQLELDLDGAITYANPAAKILLHNWRSNDNTDNNPYDVGDYAPSFLQDASFEAFTRQISKSLEITVNEKLYLFFLMPLQRTGCVHFHGIDITERKTDETILTWREENQRKLFEDVNDAIFLSNQETGIIIDCNAAASQLLDMPKSKIIGINKRLLQIGETASSIGQGKITKAEIITNSSATKCVTIKSEIITVDGKKVLQDIIHDETTQRQMEKHLRELSYKLSGLSCGDIFVCESHERCFKAYVDLTKYGITGICIIREDPKKIIAEYGINAEEIKLLSPKPIDNFKTVPDLQAISLVISDMLKTNTSCVILLDGLEYLVARFGFDMVYSLIQEKRFDFLENEALLLLPVNLGTLGEREKALLATETKILPSKID